MGQRVSFADQNLKRHVGEIVRINQRTATVHCDGRAWRVAFALLQHIVDVTPLNLSRVNDGLERTITFDYDTVKGFSQSVVVHLARTIPSRFVAKSGASNRVGKIFVDYLRNGHGATTAAAFSARARPGLGVSVPIDWDELPRVKSGAQWTVATAREHLSFQTTDPWASYWKQKQSITGSMKLLDFKP